VSDELPLAEPQARYEIAELAPRKGDRTLTLYRDFFLLERADGEPEEVDRAELPERVQMIEGNLFLRRALLVKIGKKRTVCKLSPEVFAAVSDWIGPPTMEDLKVTLRRRFSWVLPFGALFVLSALPIGRLPIRPVTLGLGLGLIATGLLAKLRPHRIFFFLDSMWFAVLAGSTAWSLTHQWSSWRFFLVVLQVSLVHSGWREYRRFAPHRMAMEPDPEQAGDLGVT
jgi:hypothetical protein